MWRLTGDYFSPRERLWEAQFGTEGPLMPAHSRFRGSEGGLNQGIGMRQGAVLYSGPLRQGTIGRGVLPR